MTPMIPGHPPTTCARPPSRTSGGCPGKAPDRCWRIAPARRPVRGTGPGSPRALAVHRVAAARPSGRNAAVAGGERAGSTSGRRVPAAATRRRIQAGLSTPGDRSQTPGARPPRTSSSVQPPYGGSGHREPLSDDALDRALADLDDGTVW